MRNLSLARAARGRLPIRKYRSGLALHRALKTADIVLSDPEKLLC
jgi:hypothetical protein